MDKWEKLRKSLKEWQKDLPKDVYVSRPKVIDEVLAIMKAIEEQE